MQVILLEKIRNLGDIGQVVDVKDGYGRNFLLKSGKALRADKKNVEYVNRKRTEINKKNIEQKKVAKEIYDKIKKEKLVFSKETIIPLPQNAGDWIALVGGVIFAAGLIRLEIIKTDGVFPIIFSFFFYGALFNIVIGFFLADYLGEMPPIEAFISMSTFLIILSVFYFIPTGIIILWSPSQLGAGLCSILFLSEIVVGVISSSILTNAPVGWRDIFGSLLIVFGGILAVVLTPNINAKT